MRVITNRFDVEQQIGAGGMSTVFRAKDRETGEVVALKVLKRGASGETERFDREARVLADLKHPTIVRYVAHGETEAGDPYLAMEWLDGEDLAQRLRRSKLTVSEALVLGVRVAEALAAAHAQGVVHRDVKPSNIFLAGGDIARTKLLDFGTARWAQITGLLTLTGTVLGTPAYMAPEQARGDKKVGPQADVFALGCVLFECLTGQPAFAADHMVATLTKLLFEEPPSIRKLRADVPKEVAEAVEQMMAKDPGKRPSSGVAAAESLGAMMAYAVEEAPPVSKRGEGPRSKRASTLRDAPVTKRSEGVASRSGGGARARAAEPSSQGVDVIASSHVPSVGTPSSRRKKRSGPASRRATGIKAALGSVSKKPGRVGPLSEAVLAVLGRHVPMPWAMLKTQCDRIGMDASNVQAADLPQLADALVKAASRFVGPAAREAMRAAILRLTA
jgi:eukaryotic-like serine/threonine-protein kinase